MDPAILGGGSDPYIEFSTLTPKFMELPGKKKGQLRKKWPKTDTVVHELNPDFPDRVVVTLRVNSDNDLRGKFLVLNVWDKDTASIDDIIGSLIINCNRFAGKSSTVVFEDEPLTRYGKKHGTISFKVDIFWPEDSGTGRFSTFRSSMSMSGRKGGEGGCCSIS